MSATTKRSSSVRPTHSSNPYVKNGVFYYTNTSWPPPNAPSPNDPTPNFKQTVKMREYRLGRVETSIMGEPLSAEPLEDSDIGVEDGSPTQVGGNRKQSSRLLVGSLAEEKEPVEIDAKDIAKMVGDEKLAEYFEAEKEDSILVLECNACSPAKDLLTAVHEKHRTSKNPYPGEILLNLFTSPSPALPFITGLRLAGTCPSSATASERVALFISIPYLGRLTSNNPEQPLRESVSLSEFTYGPDGVVGGGDVIVHQAWFLALGKGIVATFKSQECKNDNGSSPAAGQSREGCFHVLAHMVSGVLQADKDILSTVYTKTLHLIDSALTSQTAIILPSITTHLQLLTSLQRVLTRQIEIVADTVKLLHSCSPELSYSPPSSMREMKDYTTIKATTNVVALPVLSGQPEILPYMLYVLDQVLGQRKETLEGMRRGYAMLFKAYKAMLLRGGLPQVVTPDISVQPAPASEPQDPQRPSKLQPRQTVVSPPSPDNIQEIKAPTVEKLLQAILNKTNPEPQVLKDMLTVLAGSKQTGDKQLTIVAQAEQKKQGVMQAQLDGINWQAESLSWFTCVTFLFLPLGFFTQYFALDPAKVKVPTQQRFWQIVGPITGALIIGIILIILRKNYDWKEILRPFKGVDPWGRGWPRDRQEVRLLEKEKRDNQEREMERKRQASAAAAAQTFVAHSVPTPMSQPLTPQPTTTTGKVQSAATSRANTLTRRHSDGARTPITFLKALPLRSVSQQHSHVDLQTTTAVSRPPDPPTTTTHRARNSGAPQLPPIPHTTSLSGTISPSSQPSLTARSTGVTGSLVDASSASSHASQPAPNPAVVGSRRTSRWGWRSQFGKRRQKGSMGDEETGSVV